MKKGDRIIYIARLGVMESEDSLRFYRATELKETGICLGRHPDKKLGPKWYLTLSNAGGYVPVTENMVLVENTTGGV